MFKKGIHFKGFHIDHCEMKCLKWPVFTSDVLNVRKKNHNDLCSPLVILTW